jgi:hypothetical protein
MKQTAVELLFDYLVIEIRYSIQHSLEQAKAMEKEQIIDFTTKPVWKILDEDRQNPFNLNNTTTKPTNQNEKNNHNQKRKR